MADTGELTSSSGSFTVTDTKVGFAHPAVWPASICLSHELRASRLRQQQPACKPEDCVHPSLACRWRQAMSCM